MSDQEKEEMFKRNEIYIHWYINKINLRHLSDDLYDVGLIGLTNAINTYNPDMPNKENTYFIRCIINSINRYLYLQNMPKRKNTFKNIRLDEKIPNYNNFICEEVIAGPKVDIESSVEKKVILEQINDILNDMSFVDKKIIIDYFGFNGEKSNISKIAAELNVSKQAVCTRKKRILNKIRKKLEGGKYEQ